MITNKKIALCAMALACLNVACSMNEGSDSAINHATRSAQSTATSMKKMPDTLQSTLDDYATALKQKQAAQAIAMLYPAVFKVAPREQWVQRLQRSFSSNSAPTIKHVTYTPKLPAKTYAKGQYTTVPYVMSMSMQVPQAKAASTRKQLSTAQGRARFESSAASVIRLRVGGADNISFDRDSLTFKIRKSGEYIAVNEYNAGWKLIDPSMNTSKLQKGQVFPFEIGQEVRRIIR